MEETSNSETSTVSEETPPTPTRFIIVSAVRGRSNRTVRAKAPQHHRLKQFVLPQQYRLVRGRSVAISEKQLIDNIEELFAKAAVGILEVRTEAGRRLVDLAAVREWADWRKERAARTPEDDIPTKEEDAEGGAPLDDGAVLVDKARGGDDRETPTVPPPAPPADQALPTEVIAPPTPPVPQPHPPLDSAANDINGGEYIPPFEGAEKDATGPEIPFEGAAAEGDAPPEDTAAFAGGIPPTMNHPVPAPHEPADEDGEEEYKEKKTSGSKSKSDKKKKG